MRRYFDFFARAFLSLSVVGSTLLTAGCSSTPVVPLQEKERKYFFFPVQQVAAEPVYNRIRYVRPPVSWPGEYGRSEEPDTVSAPMLLPTYTLSIRKGTIEEVIRTLATAAKYTYYCSSYVAKEPLALNSSGTLDELAKEIEAKVPVRVIVDGEHKELRVLPQRDDNARADTDKETVDVLSNRRDFPLEGAVGKTQ